MYQIRIIDASDDDYRAVLNELHDETFGRTAPTPEWERGWWWLAFAEDGARDIVGFCGLTRTYDQPNTVGYLKRAGLVLAARGRNLQRRLIRVREAKAKKLGLCTIVTDTTNNPASANSLIASGYKLYTPDAPWAFKNSLYWYKDL